MLGHRIACTGDVSPPVEGIAGRGKFQRLCLIEPMFVMRKGSPLYLAPPTSPFQMCAVLMNVTPVVEAPSGSNVSDLWTCHSRQPQLKWREVLLDDRRVDSHVS